MLNVILVPLALALSTLLGLPPVGTSEEAPPPEEPLSLWYRRPATEWVEALALGNGRLGAMVFGGIANERIQLNEDTLWAGGPYDPANTDARAALPLVRRLIFDGPVSRGTRAHRSEDDGSALEADAVSASGRPPADVSRGREGRGLPARSQPRHGRCARDVHVGWREVHT